MRWMEFSLTMEPRSFLRAQIAAHQPAIFALDPALKKYLLLENSAGSQYSSDTLKMTTLLDL